MGIGLAVGLLLGACGDDQPESAVDDEATQPDAAPGPEADGGDAAPTTTAEDDPASAADDNGDGQPVQPSAVLTPDPCPGLVATAGPTVASPHLVEASGVVASIEHPGVLWLHNDSGSRPLVIATDLEGNDLGAFLVPLEDSFDIEGIALLDGQLYLADIGDNDQRRPDVAVHRFDEPVPGSSTGIGEVETFRLTYPDGPHDAEAFLVDPATGQLVIVDKTFAIGTDLSQGPLAADEAGVWVASPPLSPTIELERVGVVPLDQLAQASTAPPVEGLVGSLGVGGLATAADILPDGSLIALRTYQTAWLYEREAGQPVAEALAGEPCEAPTLVEGQGEAIGFLDGSTPAFVTVAEGQHPVLNLTTERE